MATARAHSRSSYSVLLLQKLLNLRDGVSPLTLVLDTVRESGVPLVEEMMLRAKTANGANGAARTKIVYVASHLAPRRRSPHIDVLVERRGKPLEAFREKILTAVAAAAAAGGLKVLIVVDSLCQIARQDPLFAATFVSSLVSPTASVVGIYHTDGVDASTSTMTGSSPLHRGKPHPFRILCHLATAVLRVLPLHEEVARKRARDRAEEVPRFGWAESEGWPYGYSDAALRYGTRKDLVGASTPQQALDRRGLLVTMELRRRSGRAVVEQYVVMLGTKREATTSRLPSTSTSTSASTSTSMSTSMSTPTPVALPWQRGATPCTDITVMADHPLFAAARDPREAEKNGDDSGSDDASPTSTFNLGLTDKQRRDREGIVLPYFDAQTDIGAGEGGRILYDMGREDDFDDEEDEI